MFNNDRELSSPGVTNVNYYHRRLAHVYNYLLNALEYIIHLGIHNIRISRGNHCIPSSQFANSLPHLSNQLT